MRALVVALAVAMAATLAACHRSPSSSDPASVASEMDATNTPQNQAPLRKPDLRVVVDRRMLGFYGVSQKQVITALEVAGCDVLRVGDDVNSGYGAIDIDVSIAQRAASGDASTIEVGTQTFVVVAPPPTPESIADIVLVEVNGFPVRVRDLAIIRSVP